MVSTSVKKYNAFLYSERHGRAFLIGCAVFIAEMLFLSSIQSVFAEDRESMREGLEVHQSVREIVVPSPILPTTDIPSATPVPPSPTPPQTPASGSSFQATVPSVKTGKRPSTSTTPAQSSAASVPSVGSNTSTQAMLFGAASLAFSKIGTTTPTAGTYADLGAHIKYCIVFPLLNAAGGPIPLFDVPVCPPGTTPESAPRLTVVKTVINDNEGTAKADDFSLRVNDVRVVSGVARVFSPGSYVVSEATTTVASGTTTMTYTQTFGGGCDSSGTVTLGLGDVKICTVINDDPGVGGQGGCPDCGGDPGGPGGNNDGGNGSNGDGGDSGNRGGRGGRVAGDTDPDFMGGYDPIPGTPNTGAGDIQGTVGLLIFSFVSIILGFAYLRIALKSRFLA